MADSDEFGRQMHCEAKQRRFFEAAAQAFLGDGLPWNWSLWKRHFPDFTPILDFIHPLSHLFVAAKAVHAKALHPQAGDVQADDAQADDVQADDAQAGDAWSQYLAWMRGCWQGEVDQVLEELHVWQSRLGEAPTDSAETAPRRVVAKTITYLTNNRGRMHYPDYRRAGLPVTTAWMESLAKEINLRVKGTEMFWNDPVGAEAIPKSGPPPSAKTTAWSGTSNPAPATPSPDDPNPPINHERKSKADMHP